MNNTARNRIKKNKNKKRSRSSDDDTDWVDSGEDVVDNEDVVVSSETKKNCTKSLGLGYGDETLNNFFCQIIKSTIEDNGDKSGGAYHAFIGVQPSIKKYNRRVGWFYKSKGAISRRRNSVFIIVQVTRVVPFL